MRNSSYRQVKDKQQKLKQIIIKLATEGAEKLRRPELHGNAPKDVTTQKATPSPRPRGSVFTWNPNAKRVSTTMPPR
jgi:hypothetical protein